MPNSLTNSQIAENYVYATYPCIQAWISFIQAVMPYISSYDPVSCSQISMISQTAMKTFDFILVNESNSKIIRVSRMLHDMYDSAWKTWTIFNAQGKQSTGNRQLSLTSASLQGVATFLKWDNVLNTSPSFFPPALFNVVLEGVTA